MKTLFINGSPKGKKANSEKFIKYFVKPLNKDSYDVLRLQREFLTYDINKLYNYDTIIMVLPIYIHAMPGIVMKFFERLTPISNKSIDIGFILQYGFPERFQASHLEKYLRNLSLRLNLNYLGTVTRGDAAGIQFVPENKYKTLFNDLEKLGAKFQQSNSFDPEITKNISNSSEITGLKKHFMNFIYITKLDDVFMKAFFTNKEAYKKRFDQPLKPL